MTELTAGCGGRWSASGSPGAKQPIRYMKGLIESWQYAASVEEFEAESAH